MADHRVIFVVDFDWPEDENLDEPAQAFRSAFLGQLPERVVDSAHLHVAIRESATRVLAVFEEDEMGLVKHGEGSVLPEDEQQKQGSKEGLTQEAVEEIVAEGKRDEPDGD